jgi:hypothetical protein
MNGEKVLVLGSGFLRGLSIFGRGEMDRFQHVEREAEVFQFPPPAFSLPVHDPQQLLTLLMSGDSTIAIRLASAKALAEGYQQLFGLTILENDDVQAVLLDLTRMPTQDIEFRDLIIWIRDNCPSTEEMPIDQICDAMSERSEEDSSSDIIIEYEEEEMEQPAENEAEINLIVEYVEGLPEYTSHRFIHRR